AALPFDISVWLVKGPPNVSVPCPGSTDRLKPGVTSPNVRALPNDGRKSKISSRESVYVCMYVHTNSNTSFSTSERLLCGRHLHVERGEGRRAAEFAPWSCLT
ncbi:unnamed protein product, partial [Ectocarpus fasciculatus]